MTNNLKTNTHHIPNHKIHISIHYKTLKIIAETINKLLKISLKMNNKEERK